MLIKKPADLRYSDITPRSIYLNRRRFLAGLPVALAAGRELLSPGRARAAGGKFPNLVKSPFSTTEKPNSYNDVTHYNNFYEFGTGKEQPAKLAQNFKTGPIGRFPWKGPSPSRASSPWTELIALAPLEERIYRHRCVEAWSIVVPWVGYSLSALLKQVQPTAKAKYVAFESLLQSSMMLSLPTGRHRVSVRRRPAPG